MVMGEGSLCHVEADWEQGRKSPLCCGGCQVFGFLGPVNLKSGRVAQNDLLFILPNKGTENASVIYSKRGLFIDNKKREDIISE